MTHVDSILLECNPGNDGFEMRLLTSTVSGFTELWSYEGAAGRRINLHDVGFWDTASDYCRSHPESRQWAALSRALYMMELYYPCYT